MKLTYWNQMNVQSRQAKEISKQLISDFSSQTGANIGVSWSGYGDVIGAKWKTSFSQGNYPVMYDSVSTWDGQFVEGGWVEPFDNYRDEFSDELISAVEWIFPILREQYSGFGDTIYELPFGFLIQAPFIANLSHFDEAGVDRSRYPPTSYDDMIEVAKTVQENGPGQFGLQIHGTKFDATDVMLPTLAMAEGGKDGLMLNEDWSDTNWDNDIWKMAVRQWTEIFTKHKLSSPETPNHGDENSVQEIAGGMVSMTQMDYLNHPDFMDNIPDQMNNGDVQWGTSFGGKTGNLGYIQPFVVGLTKPPSNGDASKWEEKQKAAIDFMKLWFDKDFQLSLFETFGLFPVRQDVWDQLPTAKHNLYRSAKEMAKGSNLAISAHPQSVSIQYNIPGPHLQEALQEKITPEEACDNIAQEIRDQIL